MSETRRFVVREAVPDDDEAIVRVHVDTWKTTYRGIVPDAHLDSMVYEGRVEKRRKWIQEMAPTASTFVAPDGDGTILGWATGGPERSSDREFTGELYAIYVRQEAQGLGVGGLLFRAVARRLMEQGHTFMLIWVLKQNPYQRFYQRMGGRPVREKQIEIGGAMLDEVGYGWSDLSSLLFLPPDS